MSDKDYLIKGEMYQYNLGWLIKELLSFKQDLATAIDLKTIKYADPIQWDITTQYPANTVVVDPKSGTAYMSKVPVPAGVELKNANYWVVVFNYQDIYNKIMNGVAFNDRDQDYATKDLLVNDLVWYAGDLYRATRAIPTGSKYIPGANLIKTTIESLLARYYGRDRTAQVSNDTVNVSGDYTLIAGDIAETSANRTIKVTKDREIDVDGSDSVHIDGASTLNVGGLRTEVYAGDKTVGVTGAYTERSATKIVEAATEVHNADTFNITKNLKYKTPVPVNDFYDNVPFIGQDGNTYNLMSATGRTEELSKNLGKFPGIVTIGDSYGRGEGSGTINKYTPWTALLKNYMGIDDSNYHTASIGGAGFIANLQGKTFNDLLTDLANTMTADAKTNVGKILVAGGYNDPSNITEDAMESFFATAKNNFPNAVVYVACIGWGKDRDKASQIYNNIVPVYSEGSGRYGGVYITNSQYSLHDYTWFDSDGIHPNQAGQSHIAKMLSSGLLAGSCDNSYQLKPFTISPNIDVCESCSISGYVSLKNDTINIFFDFDKTIVFNHAVNANAPIKIGTLNSDYINAISNITYCSIPVVAYCGFDSGKYFNPVANCWIQGNDVYLNFINISDDKSSFLSLGVLQTFVARFLNTTLLSGFC